VTVHQDGSQIIVSVGLHLPFDPFEALNAFLSVASGLGLNPKLVVGKRTSENAMRIAELQVAVSKPYGKATTTELKNEVHQYIALTPEDLLPSETRPNEAM
jgi:hypothetical protein